MTVQFAEPGMAKDLVSARIGSRVGAYLLDLLWVAVPSLVLLGILSAAATAQMSAGNYEAGFGLLTAAGVVPQIVSLIFGLIYVATLGAGQSPGMKAAGIRLVRVDTMGAPGFWRAMGRGIVLNITSYIIIGPFTPLMDDPRYKRGWHDKASNTWMISVASEVGSAEPSQAEVPPPLATVPMLPPPPPPPSNSARVVALPLPKPAPGGPIDAMPTPSAERIAARQPGSETVIAPRPSAAPPAEAVGLISAVPGATPHSPTMQQPTIHRPVEAPALVDDDLDRTRVSSPGSTAVSWAFHLDTGGEIAITRLGYVGRNPSNPGDPSAQLIPVFDDTKSISKTHLSFGVEGGRLWVTDRKSTNGTVLVRAGQPDVAVATDGPTFVESGDVLVLGDRRISVNAYSAALR